MPVYSKLSIDAHPFDVFDVILGDSCDICCLTLEKAVSFCPRSPISGFSRFASKEILPTQWESFYAL